MIGLTVSFWVHLFRDMLKEVATFDLTYDSLVEGFGHNLGLILLLGGWSLEKPRKGGKFLPIRRPTRHSIYSIFL